MTRVLLIALGLSAAAHAAILLVQLPTAALRESVDVSIVAMPPKEPPQVAPPEPSPAPAAQPQAQRRKVAAAVPSAGSPAAAPAPAAAPSPEPSAAPLEAAEVGIVTGTVSGAPAAGSPVGSKAAGGGGPTAQEGDDGARRLHDWLDERAYRCYPRAALRLGLEGSPLVHFCVDSLGKPQDLRLLAASGSGALDHAAMDCVVGEAAPLPVRSGCYNIPVTFHKQ